MRDALPQVEAEDELRMRQVRSPLSHGRLFELILAATGDREAADKAAADYLMSELRSGNKPVMD